MDDDFTNKYQGGLEQLLTACGYERVAGLPILTDSVPCAAYYLAAEMGKRLAEDGEVAVTVQRIGDTFFAADVTEALYAAGCSIEERSDGGVTIHLPNASGSVDGVLVRDLLNPRPLRAEDLAMPDLKRERRQSGPDYLKHDPSKRRRNRRKW